MSPRRSAPTRKRRSVWLDREVWDQADALAGREALTVGHVLSALLAAYADGAVTCTPPEHSTRGPGRRQCHTTLDEDAWQRADARRATEGFPSVSLLSELLLTDYVEGRLRVGVTVAQAA